jgi:hypothetical protein
MRGFFRFLFGLLFVLVTIFLVTLFTLGTTLFNKDYLIGRMARNDLYTKVYNVIPELTKALVDQAQGGELAVGETPPLSGEQIGRIVTDAVTPGVLREKTEGFLTGFYGWLYGEGQTIPEISLADVKPKMETYAAAEMGVPIDVIRSQGGQFKVPEKIQIQPVPPLVLLRDIFVNYNTAFAISLALFVISLTAVVLLSEDWAKRVSRPGSPMIVTGVLLTINAGLIWLFFNAGNMLYKQLSNAISGSPESINIAYVFFDGIVMDIVLKTLIFASTLIILGIALKIIGRVVRKRIEVPIGGKGSSS